jgi:hypothetical protein
LVDIDHSDLLCDFLLLEDDLSCLNRLVAVISRNQEEIVYFTERGEVVLDHVAWQADVNSWSNHSSIIVLLLRRNELSFFSEVVQK